MKFANPSRPDARDLTRTEKMTLTFLANTASSLAEVKDTMPDRIAMIDGGPELMDRLVKDSMELLTQLRMTVPERQRMSLANTARDYEIRLTPKFTPSTQNVIVQKEDFRKLVDAAQIKCVDCVDDSMECRKCELYQLLTVVLPLECYDGTMLCPYNMAEWAN